MRAFLALEIPHDTKEYLSVVSKRMSQLVPGVKWVKGEGLHVTLKFFGEIDDAMVQEIAFAMTGIGGQHKAAMVQLKEISAFPDLRRARVIIVTFQEGVDNVRAIFHDIESRLAVPEIHDSETLSTIGQTRAPEPGATLSSQSEREGEAPTALPLEGATRAPEKARAPEKSERFTPHITLGRAKGAVPLLKRDIIPLEKKRFVIDTIVLYQSTLTKAGAIYAPLKEIKLERNF
ncbi:MAG: RNA 2',3'-cyclic phosphodiesterase [Syntrophus sp. (in: bacteria)]|nr:RNA 2',3'-cyclic phosphodiesterase [Syntrophus sp. (in: bacteria)]